MAVFQQIAARMKAKNLSASALEREAGLKNHSVRNILRGKIKKPSAQVLQAVADVLECSVRDLLTGITEAEEDAPQKKLLEAPYDHQQLFLEAVQILTQAIQERQLTLSLKQFYTCLEEITLHALQAQEPKVDPAFVDWFLSLMGP